MTTLSDIPPTEISSICIRRANSKRAHAYSGYTDIYDLRRQHGETELEWDYVYGCYVMPRVGGKLATMMVYVNREPVDAD